MDRWQLFGKKSLPIAVVPFLLGAERQRTEGSRDAKCKNRTNPKKDQSCFCIYARPAAAVQLRKEEKYARSACLRQIL